MSWREKEKQPSNKENKTKLIQTQKEKRGGKEQKCEKKEGNWTTA